MSDPACNWMCDPTALCGQCSYEAYLEAQQFEEDS